MYCGHYHLNGFFYNDDVYRGDDELFNAIGDYNKAYRFIQRQPTGYYKSVSHWTYLNN